MLVATENLPSTTLDHFRSLLAKDRPRGGVALYRPSFRWQTILEWVALALAVLGFVITAAAASDPGTPRWVTLTGGGVSALFLLYAIAAMRDHLLRRSQGLDAFILVTPSHLVRCWGAHMPLELHRLGDATDFKSFQDYDQKQRYKGRKFRFVFHKEVVEFLVSDPACVAEVDEMVNLARAKGRGERLPDFPTAGLSELIPTLPQTHQGILMRAFMNPRSEFWAAVGALVCVAILVGIIASRR